ncbi:MAG: divergent PAP2 family protein [Ruminococcaceae bacterium]|nr:divergent PAP2 family protein [Oscillospiraceae bacterium]
MMEYLQVIFSNPIINATILSWFVAQLIKIILVMITTRKLDLSRMFGSGGMPSSHSSGMVALSAMVLRTCGFSSVEFAICFSFSLVVMYDAAGVRRATGKHATIINRMMKLYNDGENIFGEKSLKELIGHTPLQVVMGALLGLIIGFSCPI